MRKIKSIQEQRKRGEVLDIVERVEKTVEDTIREYKLIHSEDTVVLGLSGGSDSVALMNVLLKLSKKMDFNLACAHLNHGVRGQAAQADREFSEELCKSKGIRCFSSQLSKSMESEEDGRNARYDFFGQVVHAVKKERGLLDNISQEEEILTGDEDIETIARVMAASDLPRQPQVRVAVAHNRDDQVETILHNILRGTAIAGVGGMNYIRLDNRGYEIIRPLMDVSKEEVRDYCAAQGLEVCEDHTNQERTYERNRLRLDTLPYLRENHNANLDEALLRLAAGAREDDDYFKKFAKQAIAKGLEDYDNDYIVLSLYELEYLEPPIIARVIKLAFAEIGLILDINRAQIVDGTKIILEGETSKQVDFPHGYRLRIGYRQVIFEAPSAQEGPDQEELRIEKRLMDYQDWKREFPNGIGDLPKNVACFDADKIGDRIDSIVIRNREPGDFIAIGGIGTKKLQDFFVDSKIPKEIRDDVNIVFSGGEALWICGKGFPDRYSPIYKVDGDTKRVLLIETITKL